MAPLAAPVAISLRFLTQKWRALQHSHSLTPNAARRRVTDVVWGVPIPTGPCEVYDIQINPATQATIVFTYGRGAYQLVAASEP
jgi:hypothetical protein